MGIIDDIFLKTLKNTDNLISQENIANLSGPLSKIIEIVTHACDFVFEKHHSIFLTGSLAICLRSGSLKEFRTSGDRSDIDLWIIADESTTKLSKLSGLEKEIINGFLLLKNFDISCVPFPENKLNISLKIMHSTTARKILQFNKIKLSVFRCNSLKKVKTKNIFYGIKRIHCIPIDEEKIKTGNFLWHWPTNPFVGQDFVLTDIHSCFLIGGFLTDYLELKKERNLFLKKFCFYLKKYREKNITNNLYKILQYFYDRFPSSATKIFGKEKGQIHL
jgi:hypothetical protein